MNNSGLGYVGQTSRIITVLIQGTDGKGIAGLAYTGVTCYASKNAGASSARTLATMTGATWASLGFNEIDATHMPGAYRFGIPDTDQAAAGDIVYVFTGTGIGLGTYNLITSASNSLAAAADVSGLATTDNLNIIATGLATSISTVNTNVTVPTAGAKQAMAQEMLVTFNGKRGNKIILDKTSLLSIVKDVDGSTTVSSEPITLDTNGNVIALG